MLASRTSPTRAISQRSRLSVDIIFESSLRHLWITLLNRSYLPFTSVSSPLAVGREFSHLHRLRETDRFVQIRW